MSTSVRHKFSHVYPPYTHIYIRYQYIKSNEDIFIHTGIFIIILWIKTSLSSPKGTPIVRAAQMGDVKLIKRLAAKGADPAKARKEDKVHALVVAAYHGRVEV